MTKTKRDFVLAAIFFALVVLSISSVRAQLDDRYFEDIRGELLNFYSSEIVAHAGLIIGLVVGSLALIAKWKDFFNDSKPTIDSENAKDPKPANNAIWRKFLFFLLIGLVLSLTMYSLGRLLFWSYLGADLLGIKTTDLPEIPANSTSTGVILQLYNLTIIRFENSSAFSSKFAKALFPNCWGVVTTVLVIFLPPLTWYVWTSPMRRSLTKQMPSGLAKWAVWFTILIAMSAFIIIRILV